MLTDQFNTEEDLKNFLRRLNALMHITDFQAVLEVLRKHLVSTDELIRYAEADFKLRQLQGRSQILSELFDLIDQSKAGQI